MTAAPIGNVVTLTSDLVRNPYWPDPDEGDWLVSYSEATDTYVTTDLMSQPT